jgi:NAD(P)-dependent dehydrogenase (short-subunit alcohol dehydrogenase family)
VLVPGQAGERLRHGLRVAELLAIPRLGGSHVAWAALAGLCRQLAAEFGPSGVRVNWLLSPGPSEGDEPSERQDVNDPGGAEAAPRYCGPADPSPAQL